MSDSELNEFSAGTPFAAGDTTTQKGSRKAVALWERGGAAE
jgi:hypothetical protein